MHAAPLPPVTVLAHHDVAGPRYTSYPTADRFAAGFGDAQYHAALLERRRERLHAPLGLYVHVPFCASVCYYCGCNKVVTRDTSRADDYLDALEREIALHVAALGEGAAVSSVHLGGGTPTFLDDAQLSRLMAMLHGAFAIAPGAERAIEIDPRTVDLRRLVHLKALGFDRLSFGVQDFDPDVQRAVHRVQPHERVAALVHDARGLDFDGIGVDLIYGLPRQTAASFARTLAQVCTLAPDRVAMYGYAHLPERFKPQRCIDASLLPDAGARLDMLRAGIDAFGAAGYEYIGMDHFARPEDPLAVAKRQGRLHRNFQGYAVHPDGDVVGLGVSAIGQVGAHYAQNAKTLPEYAAALRDGRFATARGIALDADDVLRRAVILAVMCQGRVDLDALGAAHAVDVRRVLAPEIAGIAQLAARGLVALEPNGFRVTPTGWYVVRGVAMVFDRYLQPGGGFSRIV